MTAHPQENPDAYGCADMDAEIDARKRGCMTDAGKDAESSPERRQEDFAWILMDLVDFGGFCMEFDRC